jgi:hypothetical protein
MVFIKQDVAVKVGQLLGKGVYESWLSVLDAFDDEAQRAASNSSRLRKYPVSQSVQATLDTDLAAAKLIFDDFFVRLGRVDTEGTVAARRCADAINALELAISILTLDNDCVDALFEFGIVAAVEFLVVSPLAYEAKRMRDLLEALLRALTRAKHEEAAAGVQTGVDVVIGALTLFTTVLTGPVGLLVVVGVGASELVAGAFLEPPAPTSVTVAGDANKTLSMTMSASKQYLKLSDTTTHYIGKAGTVCAFVGIAFDAKKLLTGYDNLSHIEGLLKQARMAQRRLVTSLQQYRSTFTAILEGIERYNASGKKMLAQTRATLQFQLQRTGYRPGVQ